MRYPKIDFCLFFRSRLSVHFGLQSYEPSKPPQSNHSNTTHPITAQPSNLSFLPLTLTPPLPIPSNPHVALPFATTAPKYGIVTVAVGLTPPNPTDCVTVALVLELVTPTSAFTTLTTLASQASNPAAPCVCVEHGLKFSTGVLEPGGTLMGPGTMGKSAEMGTLVAVVEEEVVAAVDVDGGGQGITLVPEIRSV
jgi:hypothetical protein